jgi:hypothetical protein
MGSWQHCRCCPWQFPISSANAFVDHMLLQVHTTLECITVSTLVETECAIIRLKDCRGDDWRAHGAFFLPPVTRARQRRANLLVQSDMKPHVKRICDQEKHMVVAEFMLEDSKLLTVVTVYNPVGWQYDREKRGRASAA